MQVNLDRVGRFFAGSGKFECSTYGGDIVTSVETYYVLGPPATDAAIARVETATGKTLTRSHKMLLSRWDGMRLFCQDTPHGTMGFQLYGTADIPEETEWVIEAIAGDLSALLEYYEEDNKDEEAAEREALRDAIDRWVPGLLVVGEELMSGNYVALDYFQAGGRGAPPVVFLGHELRSTPPAVPIIARGMNGLMERIMADPARFLRKWLGGITHYSDREGRDWLSPRRYLST